MDAYPFTEHLLPDVTHLTEGQTHEVAFAGQRVLVIRHKGQLHAMAALCPHYHLPLKDGLVHNGHLRCGWHQSCFRLQDGSALEPPALDAVAVYPIRQEGTRLFVQIATQRFAAPPPPAPSDPRTFVLIGGGAAGMSAAQTLREDGFGGRIVMLSDDPHPPCDRPSFSKNYLAGQPLDAPTDLQPPQWFAEHRVERLRAKADRLDPANRTIMLADGSSLLYDAALIATGGIPRQLDVPGADLPNVFTLRTRGDADAIIRAAHGARSAVVVGSSFIAMEAAACLRQRGLSVHVVMRDAQPFEHTLGPQIGKLFRREHESHGVVFVPSSEVTEVLGGDRVGAVRLADGSELATDLVLAGIGVRPATDFLPRDLLDENGGVLVDEHFRVTDTLFAAGDIAAFPEPITARRARIEHWRTALQQGRVAARNMLGGSARFEDVPYFWTYQFDLGVDYVGHAPSWDEIVIDGDVDRQDFTGYFVKDGAIHAAAGCGRSKQMCALAEMMRQRRHLGLDQVRAGKFDAIAALTA